MLIAIFFRALTSLAKTKTTIIFRVPCFIYMYVFFRVPNWPKIGIFLGLGFSLTFGLPSYFSASPTPGVRTGHANGKECKKVLIAILFKLTLLVKA